LCVHCSELKHPNSNNNNNKKIIIIIIIITVISVQFPMFSILYREKSCCHVLSRQ
jgi:hypothetical protein